MNLGFCPLASSSQGNSYLIKSDETVIVLDAGITGKGLKENMAKLEMHPRDIDGIVITHEHIDHIKGLGRILSLSENSKLYCSEGTYDGIKEKHKNIPEEKVSVIAPDNETVFSTETFDSLNFVDFVVANLCIFNFMISPS